MRPLLVIFAFVLFLRLPFLNQAVQGDDYYYLAGAQHAQIDPWHPHHAKYVFLGETVDMRGHPHPPGNAWILGGLLWFFGDIREVPFHAAYLLFSLIAAWSMWRLATRFVPDLALEATLLFLAVPAFVVNGTSLEADLPLLCFWMLGTSLTIEAVDARSAFKLILAAAALAVAGLMAYQSVMLIPILGLYAWPRWRNSLPALLTPALAITAYQLGERFSTGVFPFQVLSGHMTRLQLQTSEMKIRNAVALTGHLVMMLSPLGLVGIWRTIRRREQAFCLWWTVMFFIAALILFFAGAARYLLPLSAPMAILAATGFRGRKHWIAACFIVQLAVGLGLAWVNYQHWAGYRTFAREVFAKRTVERVWVDGEWGLRFYAEERGGLPLVNGQSLRPGDWILSSELGGGVAYTTGGAQPVLLRKTEIAPALPLRLVGKGSGSGYSSVSFGLLPFGWSSLPIDRVAATQLLAREPVLSWLAMNESGADAQIVSGVYSLENAQWRWATADSSFVLKPPPGPKPIAIDLYLPDAAPGRQVRVQLDGRTIVEQALPAAGSRYRVTTPPVTGTLLRVLIDKDFQVAGDSRKLGMVLIGLGYSESGDHVPR